MYEHSARRVLSRARACVISHLHAAPQGPVLSIPHTLISGTTEEKCQTRKFPHSHLAAPSLSSFLARAIGLREGYHIITMNRKDPDYEGSVKTLRDRNICPEH